MAQWCISNQIFMSGSNSVVWLWVSPYAISSENEAATVRGVKRPSNVRVEETVVNHSCTRPPPGLWAEPSLPHLRNPGWLIKVSKTMYKYRVICGRLGVGKLHCILPACLWIFLCSYASARDRKSHFRVSIITLMTWQLFHLWLGKWVLKTLYFIKDGIIQ